MANGAPTVPQDIFGLTYDIRTGGAAYIERLNVNSSELVLINLDMVEVSRTPIAGFGPFFPVDKLTIDPASGLCILGSTEFANPGTQGTIQAVDVAGNVAFEVLPPETFEIGSPVVLPGVGFALRSEAIGGESIQVYDLAGQLLDVLLVARDPEFPQHSLLSVGNDARLFRSPNVTLVGASEFNEVSQLVWGSTGSAYCDQTPNSTGLVGRLRIVGSEVATEDRMTLAADRLPADSFSLFVTGTAPAAIPAAGGSAGVLCVGGQLGRLNAPGQVRQTSATGQRSLELDLALLPGPSSPLPAMAGDTRTFQLWHRDTGLPEGSHLTNAVRVMFQ